MMDLVPPIVKRKLESQVLTSHVKDIIAFQFLSEYRFCPNNIETVVYTKRGELIEYNEREVKRSLRLEEVAYTCKFLLHYNSTTGKISYLIHSANKLYIVFANECNLSIQKLHSNIQSCEIGIGEGSTKEVVKVWCYNDILPCVLNDSYDIDTQIYLMDVDGDQKDEQFNLMLKCKLNEARYIKKRNTNVHEENVELRKELCHIITDEVMSGRVTKDGPTEIICDKSWIQVCNEKLVINLKATNQSDSDTVTNLTLLLKCSSEKWQYDTHIYNHEVCESFKWKKNVEGILKPKTSCVVIAVSDRPKFEQAPFVEYSGYLTYVSRERVQYICISDMILNGLKMIRGDYDTIGENLGSLGSTELLHIVATSNKLSLDIHFEEYVQSNYLHNLFIDFGFSKWCSESKDTFIHWSNPFHILHGLLVNIQRGSSDLQFRVDLCARTKSQVLALVNFMYDSVKQRVSIVPAGTKISPKVALIQKKLSESMFDCEIEADEEKPERTADDRLRLQLCSALKKQIEIIIRYFDVCLDVMGASREKQTQALIGQQIDLLAPGIASYKKFSAELENEIANGYSVANVLKEIS